MARLLWPTMLVLLFLAVAGPSLTFYLLIKDYWAEVSSLRRDLLFCQLGSTQLPLRFDLDLEAASTSPSPPLPLPPAPLPLVATTASTITTIKHTPSSSSPPPTTFRTSPSPPSPVSRNQPPASPPSPSPISISRLSVQSPPSISAAPSQRSASSGIPAMLGDAKLDVRPLEVPLSVDLSPRSTRPPRSLKPEVLDDRSSSSDTELDDQSSSSDTELDDQSSSSDTELDDQSSSSDTELDDQSSSSDTELDDQSSSSDTELDDQSSTSDTDGHDDKEYVALLERQLRDLRARTNACRSCLPSPQRKLATCGGGKAWRDFRRRRRLIRRKERQQRRERRRDKKNKQLNTANNVTTSTTPKSTPTTIFTQAQPDLADQAYSDQKMDNQRARETHRMSTDFRRGFNQKISRMDEALMQFTDTQASFCKELRDNLGGRLEKRGQELEALSNQIASLVRTSTAQITALEKVASDQLYAGQVSIEKSLAVTQAIRDSQLRAIQNYHKQTFLPAAAAVATVLTDQASALTSMGVELITKVEMLQDVYLTYATRQADTLQKLSQDVEMFASKHNNLVMRSRDHANHLNINAQNFVRELQTRMSNVVKELVLIRLQSQNFVSLNNDTHNDFSNSLNMTQSAVDTLSESLKNRLDNATVLEQDFRKIFKRETNHISDRVENGISQALVSNHATVSQIEETELDTRVFVGSATAAWNELYLNQEAELRKEADSLSHSLRTHTHHTQNVLTGMRSAAETHELVLEEQRMNFQRFIHKRQDALDNQCSAITDWAMLMSTELRRRDEDLHRFLSEDLQYTTVTVQEDEDGYLVSRLPDGSLLHQSSRSHTHDHARAARPPPNVNYQLDETAYSPGLLSSVSHSSPNKPQLEKTVVAYVNNTGNIFRASSSGTTSENSNNPSDIHSDPLSVQNQIEEYDIFDEIRKTSDSDSVREMQQFGFHQHGKMTRNNGSSSQEFEMSRNTLSRMEAEREMDVHTHSSAYSQVSQETADDSVLGPEENVIQENHIVKSKEDQTGHQQENLHIHREVLDSDNRQNDGTYKPRCTSESQAVHNETSKIGQSNKNKHGRYDDDDDDKGIKKLRKILKEAQESIKKFQMDFELEGIFKISNVSRSQEAVVADHLADVSNINGTRHSNHSNCGSVNSSDSLRGNTAQDKVEEEYGTTAHRLRHQQQRYVHRMLSHSRLGENIFRKYYSQSRKGGQNFARHTISPDEAIFSKSSKTAVHSTSFLNSDSNLPINNTVSGPLSRMSPQVRETHSGISAEIHTDKGLSENIQTDSATDLTETEAIDQLKVSGAKADRGMHIINQSGEDRKFSRK
ncbi:serine-rich adhesin for platelets isoform X2 [Cherax quadricarinatus]|uniref:serine-rich adhesin for platelets isoform X2 n=1 Tax=Cherax quadricarinatus TaxID=27406 RepID=UPI00387E4531